MSSEYGPSEKTVTIRLPQGIYERVRKCAESNAMSVKLVIRSAVLSWLGNEQEELVDALSFYGDPESWIRHNYVPDPAGASYDPPEIETDRGNALALLFALGMSDDPLRFLRGSE